MLKVEDDRRTGGVTEKEIFVRVINSFPGVLRDTKYITSSYSPVLMNSVIIGTSLCHKNTCDLPVVFVPYSLRSI